MPNEQLVHRQSPSSSGRLLNSMKNRSKDALSPDKANRLRTSKEKQRDVRDVFRVRFSKEYFSTTVNEVKKSLSQTFLRSNRSGKSSNNPSQGKSKKSQSSGKKRKHGARKKPSKQGNNLPAVTPKTSDQRVCFKKTSNSPSSSKDMESDGEVNKKRSPFKKKSLDSPCAAHRSPSKDSVDEKAIRRPRSKENEKKLPMGSFAMTADLRSRVHQKVQKRLSLRKKLDEQLMCCEENSEVMFPAEGSNMDRSEKFIKKAEISDKLEEKSIMVDYSPSNYLADNKTMGGKIFVPDERGEMIPFWNKKIPQKEMDDGEEDEDEVEVIALSSQNMVNFLGGGIPLPDVPEAPTKFDEYAALNWLENRANNHFQQDYVVSISLRNMCREMGDEENYSKPLTSSSLTPIPIEQPKTAHKYKRNLLTTTSATIEPREKPWIPSGKVLPRSGSSRYR